MMRVGVGMTKGKGKYNGMSGWGVVTPILTFPHQGGRDYKEQVDTWVKLG